MVRILFAQWLDTTMTNKGITGRRLAKDVGVHDSAVSRWRSGASTPSLEACVRVAQALGVDPLRLVVTAGLLHGDAVGIDPLPLPEPVVRRERVRRQIESIQGLDDDARQALLERYDEVAESVNTQGPGV